MSIYPQPELLTEEQQQAARDRRRGARPMTQGEEAHRDWVTGVNRARQAREQREQDERRARGAVGGVAPRTTGLATGPRPYSAVFPPNIGSSRVPNYPPPLPPRRIVQQPRNPVSDARSQRAQDIRNMMRRNAVRQAVQPQPVGRPPRRGVVFADDIPEYVTGSVQRTPGRRIFANTEEGLQALTADLSEYDREELEYEAHERALADAEAVENDVDLNSQQVDHQRQESLRRRRQLCQRRLNRREELESQQNGFGKRKGVLKRLQMDLAKLKKV